VPPPDQLQGGRPPPPTPETTAYFFFFFAAFFFAMCALTSSPRRVVRSFIGVEPLLLLFLGRLLLLHRLTPFSNRCSEPHRLTAEMLGLVRPLALVVQKIDVELGQRGDLEPAFLEHA